MLRNQVCHHELLLRMNRVQHRQWFALCRVPAPGISIGFGR